MKLYQWIKHLWYAANFTLGGIIAYIFGLTSSLFLIFGFFIGAIIEPMVIDYIDEKESENYEDDNRTT